MAITGSILIGNEEIIGTQGTQRAVNPATNAEMAPVFGGGILLSMELQDDHFSEHTRLVDGKLYTA